MTNDGTVGLGTALEAGRSWVRFLMVSLEFFLDLSLWLHYDRGVDSASDKNEYQEYFLGGKGIWCLGLKILPPSCADYLQIWDPHPAGTLSVCPGIALH